MPGLTIVTVIFFLSVTFQVEEKKTIKKKILGKKSNPRVIGTQNENQIYKQALRDSINLLFYLFSRKTILE